MKKRERVYEERSDLIGLIEDLMAQDRTYQSVADVARAFDSYLHDVRLIKDTEEHFTPEMLSEVLRGKRLLEQATEYRLYEFLGQDPPSSVGGPG